MRGQKISTLYFSPTGNTKLVCETIGKSLSDEVITYDRTPCKNRENPLIFTQDDLVIIGLPCYYGRMPDLKASFFKGISGGKALAILVTTYGNRAYDDSLLEMKIEAEASGFKCVAAGAFISQHCLNPDMAKNRPDGEDIKSIRGFGELVKAQLATLENTHELILEVGGHFPYVVPKPSGMVPVTLETCSQCMICQKGCPMEAISLLDAAEVDKSRCILCGKCIKYCPLKAKQLPDKVRDHVRTIGLNCKERKETKIFLF